MATLAQNSPLNNLCTTSSALLLAQREWLQGLIAQHTASAAVPSLIARIDGELATRTAEHVAALQSIVQRPSWAVQP